MLKNNLKTLREAKGISQEELATKLHAVRQTISKWERGLSVPDAEMLVKLSEVFDTPVSTILGEDIPEAKADDLKAISEKLEVINLQLSQRKEQKRKTIHYLLISLCCLVVITLVALFFLNSPYTGWNYDDPEYVMLGTIYHSFEWLFARISPFILAGLIIGIVLTRKKE